MLFGMFISFIVFYTFSFLYFSFTSVYMMEETGFTF